MKSQVVNQKQNNRSSLFSPFFRVQCNVDGSCWASFRTPFMYWCASLALRLLSKLEPAAAAAAHWTASVALTVTSSDQVLTHCSRPSGRQIWGQTSKSPFPWESCLGTWQPAGTQPTQSPDTMKWRGVEHDQGKRWLRENEVAITS